MNTSQTPMNSRLKIFVCVLVLFTFISFPIKSAHALTPKAKVVALTAGYGAAAGALIGVASLAFGTKTRAIFIGSSIGLYAGILVGAYMVFFPPNKTQQQIQPGPYPNEKYSLLIEKPTHLSMNGLSQIQPEFQADLISFRF